MRNSGSLNSGIELYMAGMKNINVILIKFIWMHRPYLRSWMTIHALRFYNGIGTTNPDQFTT